MRTVGTLTITTYNAFGVTTTSTDITTGNTFDETSTAVAPAWWDDVVPLRAPVLLGMDLNAADIAWYRHRDFLADLRAFLPPPRRPPAPRRAKASRSIRWLALVARASRMTRA